LDDNYFFAVDVNGDESDIALYISDGTSAGTIMLKSGFHHCHLAIQEL
jgi:hypothetical protein